MCRLGAGRLGAHCSEQLQRQTWEEKGAGRQLELASREAAARAHLHACERVRNAVRCAAAAACSLAAAGCSCPCSGFGSALRARTSPGATPPGSPPQPARHAPWLCLQVLPSRPLTQARQMRPGNALLERNCYCLNCLSAHMQTTRSRCVHAALAGPSHASGAARCTNHHSQHKSNGIIQRASNSNQTTVRHKRCTPAPHTLAACACAHPAAPRRDRSLAPAALGCTVQATRRRVACHCYLANHGACTSPMNTSSASNTRDRPRAAARGAQSFCTCVGGAAARPAPASGASQ